MIRYFILLLWLASSTQSGLSQPTIITLGDRTSEEQIITDEIYISAFQKKILGKYEEAIKLYKKILEKNEVTPSVHHDMAEIYLAMVENEKALSSARKAVRYAPENHWFLLTLAEIYEASLEYEVAANTIEKVIKMAPDASLYHRKAYNLDQANKKEEAIKTYDLADERYGWDAYRSDSKVDLYLALGKEKDAINEVKKWTKRNPENIESWLKLATFFEFLGDEKNARKIFEKVHSMDADNEEALYKTQKYKKTNELGSELSILIGDPRIGVDNKIKSLIPLLGKKERLDEIIDLCQSLITQYPENAKTYALYGDVLWLAEDASGAIPLYEQSLSFNKSVYQVWDQLMMALVVEKKYDRLLDLSSEAQDYYPNQAGPYYYNALAFYALGQLEDALELNLEALFIASTGGGYIAEQSRILSASILDAQGKTKEAISVIESIGALNQTAGLLELLGDLYIKTGNKVGAQNAWKKSINLGGDKIRLGLKIQSI